MRPYELMLVLRPDLDDDGVAATVAQVSEVIAGQDGEMVSAGQLADKKGNVVSGDAGWKTRRLAYTIGNHREGYYVVLQFMAPPNTVNEVERVVNLRDDVLRHLVVRLEELTEVLPAPQPPPARGKAGEASPAATEAAAAEAPVAVAPADAGDGGKDDGAESNAEAPAAVDSANVDEAVDAAATPVADAAGAAATESEAEPGASVSDSGSGDDEVPDQPAPEGAGEAP